VLALNVWSMLSGRFDASDPFIQGKAETMGSATAGAILSVLRGLITAPIGRECRSMEIMWRPVQVGVDSFDEEGQWVLVDGTRVAILVHRTSPFNNPELQRSWACVLDPSLTEERTQPERVPS
jgi:hypothetical protein